LHKSSRQPFFVRRWIVRTFLNLHYSGSRRRWRRRWISGRFCCFSYSKTGQGPEKASRGPAGVGFLKDLGKNPFRIFGAAGAGWDRRCDLSEIATPDFFGKKRQMDLANFFKFALLRVATMAARQMDLARIWPFILLPGASPASQQPAAAWRSRIFERFCQKSISDFWRRRVGVVPPARFVGDSYPGLFRQNETNGSCELFQICTTILRQPLATISLFFLQGGGCLSIFSLQ